MALAVAIERTMLVFATRLPHSSARKSLKMRDGLLQWSDGGRALHDGTRALTESGQQLSPEKAVRSQSFTVHVRSAAGVTQVGNLNRRWLGKFVGGAGPGEDLP